MSVIRKTISVPDDLVAEADSIRKSAGQSFSRFALEAIREKVDRETKRKLEEDIALAAREYRNNPGFREEMALWDTTVGDGM